MSEALDSWNRDGAPAPTILSLRNGLVALHDELEKRALTTEEDRNIVLALGWVVPSIEKALADIERVPASVMDPIIAQLWERLRASKGD